MWQRNIHLKIHYIFFSMGPLKSMGFSALVQPTLLQKKQVRNLDLHFTTVKIDLGDRSLHGIIHVYMF